jgi:hypothetical protein
MILDAFHEFSNGQALTSTAASTNVIDFSSDRNIGVGEPMAVLLLVDVAADDADGNETYSVAVQTDTVENFASADTLATITITRGDAAGTRYVAFIPKNEDIQQYLRLNYTLGGTSPSVTVSAYLLPADGIDAYKSYPNGYTISG